MIPQQQSDPATPTSHPARFDPHSSGDKPTETVRIPVIEEQLQVDKQLIETGQVRLVKTVHQMNQSVSVPLLAEHIDVERVAIDELVEQAPPTRQEGETTIYPVLREEYVVVKRLRLVEEIRVTRRHVQTTQQQTILLRREEVAVERTAPNVPSERSDSLDESSL